MAQPVLEDSVDPWKYVILLSKFVLLFVDGGLAKSFGVLIPEVVARYQTDFKTVAFVLSLPSTMMYFTVPIAILLMKLMTPRTMAMTGGILSAVPIICAPLAKSIYLLGVMLALTGFGMALTFFPIMVSINSYFSKSFIFSNTLTLFGSTCGAFVAPVIVERSLEAYGYNGGFLILGGISLHAVVCGAVVRPPRDSGKHLGNPSQEEHDSLMKDQATDHIAKGRIEGETEPDGTSASLVEVCESSYEPDSRYKDKTTNSQRDTSSHCLPKALGARLKSLIFLKEPLYTLIAPAMILQCFVMYGWMLFLVPHAEGKGIDRSNAVFLSSIAGISGIFGRIVYLVLLHFNCDNKTIFGFACVICAISFLIDSVGSTYVFLAVMAFIQGSTLFILDCVPHAMMKLSVREENIPGAIAANPFLVGIGVITGDVVSGYIYDVTASFTTVFLVYGVLLLLVTANLLLFTVLNRRRDRAQMTDMTE